MLGVGIGSIPAVDIGVAARQAVLYRNAADRAPLGRRGGRLRRRLLASAVRDAEEPAREEEGKVTEEPLRETVDPVDMTMYRLPATKS